MNVKNNIESGKRYIDKAAFILKCLLSVWVLSCDSLSLLLNGYAADIPILKYMLTVFESMDGWGMEAVFMFIALSLVFYKVRDRQKNPAVSGLSALFSIFTITGISLSKTGNMDCIFLFGTQFMLAVVVWLGYYYVYKNCILFCIYILESNKQLFSSEPHTKFGKKILNSHPVAGPLVFMLLTEIVWIIAFFPGTIQPDAYIQLLMKCGEYEMTGHYPVISTELIGLCIDAGRYLFGSDSAGVFIYTLPQYVIQCLVFTYTLYLMYRMKSPVLLRGAALLAYSVAPLFPIWGITVVKDTYYYIFFTLMICSLIDLLTEKSEKRNIRARVLLIVACAFMPLFRNDGKYVVVLSMLFALIFMKKYRRNVLAGMAACIFVVLMVEKVYMPANDIKAGPIRESLSIPLQQTARYISEHPDDITQEEQKILQSVFDVDIYELPEMYNPGLSDSVKALFVYEPDLNALKNYFKVWFNQLLRHPDTYIQAFLNQTYAYIYPDAHELKSETYFFYIVYGEALHDGNFDVDFGIQNSTFRNMLRHYGYLFEKLPVLSMFTSAGIYTYILLGEALYLIISRQRKKIVVLIPLFIVFLVNMAAPVNGCIRYTLPIIASTPLILAWCMKKDESQKADAEREPLMQDMNMTEKEKA
jgi:hypothetical protein